MASTSNRRSQAHRQIECLCAGGMSPRRWFNQGIRMQDIFANGRRVRACLLAGLGIAVSVPASVVCAQGTAGSIFGHGPAGSDVIAVSATGAQRHATVGAKGRYSIDHVQMGTYAVTLQKDGKDIDTRKNVGITVGRGAEVDFACPGDKCAAAD